MGHVLAYEIYVPMIPVARETPEGTGGTPVTCGLNEQEAIIAGLMVEHPDQKRVKPVCDPILAQVARARARDMAQRNYFDHINPDGNGPNYLVVNAGYALPRWYGNERDANNIESIAGGQTSAEAAWAAWIKSDGHRPHVLGLKDFYAGQTTYGIGYFYNPDARLKHYWVFLSAPPEEE
jgi:hypothetical protein